jgi:hypothetical protein
LACKEKTLSLGTYPDVPLKEARTRRDGARNLIANGTDPAIVKRLDADAAKIGGASTFKSVADEYIGKTEKKAGPPLQVH